MKDSLILMVSKVVHVTGDLNKPNIVTTSAGLACLATFGGGVCCICRKKYAIGSGLLVSTVGFGVVFKLLSDKDSKEKERDYAHEERMASIKHPHSAAKEDEQEANRPAYLIPMDKTPTSHTLNELANAKGVDLLHLFGIYLYSGDICIFFSTANKGKTVVAIQMAIDIATGKQSLFPDDRDIPKQKVVYINFEMNNAQMKKRLTGKDGKAIIFPENIDIRDCKGCFKDVNEFLAYLAKMAESDIASDTTIFIDTITDICPMFFSKEASMVLNALRTIQTHAFQNKGITLTFVIEGHANKKHDWEPMELENLKGGVNQANLADSIFALGCGVEGSRYLKVLKARNDERPETVDVINISRKDYLLPEWIRIAKEEDILPHKPTKKGMSGVTPLSEEQKPAWDGKLSLERTKEMKAFYQKGVTGHGYEACAKKFGLNYSTDVQREIEKLDIYLASISEG